MSYRGSLVHFLLQWSFILMQIVEGRLGSILDNVVVAPHMIRYCMIVRNDLCPQFFPTHSLCISRKITDSDVDDVWLQYLLELNKKMRFVKANQNKPIRALQDIGPELEKLRLKVMMAFLHPSINNSVWFCCLLKRVPRSLGCVHNTRLFRKQNDYTSNTQHQHTNSAAVCVFEIQGFISFRNWKTSRGSNWNSPNLHQYYAMVLLQPLWSLPQRLGEAPGTLFCAAFTSILVTC